MGLRATLINASLDFLFRTFCRIDDSDLKKLPLQGPAILLSNHTSNLEGPLFYVRLRPRPTIALAKAELWKVFATRMIMEAWSAIPVRRGRLDRQALGRCQRVLERGEFLCLAPEGRRSKDGTLLRGQPGTAWFAADKNIPVYPMVQWGCRTILKELAHLRRPHIVIRVGRPFVVATPEEHVGGRDQLQAMADEIMGQVALALPEEYRGYYRDPALHTTNFLKFV